MAKILLRIPYTVHPAGKVLETDEEKVEALVSLGYGTRVEEEYNTKVMRPRKKRTYKTK